jgi:hypothetical protein
MNSCKRLGQRLKLQGFCIIYVCQTRHYGPSVDKSFTFCEKIGPEQRESNPRTVTCRFGIHHDSLTRFHLDIPNQMLHMSLESPSLSSAWSSLCSKIYTHSCNAASRHLRSSLEPPLFNSGFLSSQMSDTLPRLLSCLSRLFIPQLLHLIAPKITSFLSLIGVSQRGYNNAS